MEVVDARFYLEVVDARFYLEVVDARFYLEVVVDKKIIKCGFYTNLIIVSYDEYCINVILYFETDTNY